MISASALTSIPVFRADTDNTRDWVVQIDRYGSIYGWDDVTKLEVAKARMDAKATRWLNGTGRDIAAWVDFKKRIVQRFDKDAGILHHQLAACVCEAGETVRGYSDRYLELIAALDIDPDRDPIYQANFVRGLSSAIGKKVYAHRPKTLAEAIEIACYLEDGKAFFETASRSNSRERLVRFETPTPQDDDEEEEEVPVRRVQKGRWEGRRPQPQAPYRRESTPPSRPNMEADVQDLEKQLRQLKINLRQNTAERSVPVNAYDPGKESEGTLRRLEALERELSTLKQQQLVSGRRYELVHGPPRQPNRRYNTATYLCDLGSEGSDGGDGDVEDEFDLNLLEPLRAPYFHGTRSSNVSTYARQPPRGRYNPEAFTKRVRDFEPTGRLPRRRTTVPFEDGAAMEVDPTPRGEQSETPPRPTPRQATTTPATVEHIEDTAAANPLRVPEPIAPRRRVTRQEEVDTQPQPREARPTRAAAQASPRTDQVPADPEATERRVSSEMVAKVLKYPVPLGTMLNVDAISICSKVGGKLLGIARTARQNPGALATMMGTETPATGARRTHTTNVLSAATKKGVPVPKRPVLAPRRSASILNAVPLRQPRPKFTVCRTTILMADGAGNFQKVDAVVDTGAAELVVTRNTLRNLELQDFIEQTGCSFINADGDKKKAAGYIRDLTISTGDMKISLNGFVSNATNYGVLLGTAFLQPLRAKVDYENGLIEYDNDQGGRSSIPMACTTSDTPLYAMVDDDTEEESDGTGPEVYFCRLLEVPTETPTEEAPPLPLPAAWLYLPDEEDWDNGATDPIFELPSMDWIHQPPNLLESDQDDISILSATSASLASSSPESDDMERIYREWEDEPPALIDEDDGLDAWWQDHFTIFGWKGTEGVTPSEDGPIGLEPFEVAYKEEPAPDLQVKTETNPTDGGATSKGGTTPGNQEEEVILALELPDCYRTGNISHCPLDDHLEVAVKWGRKQRLLRDKSNPNGPDSELEELLRGKINPELAAEEKAVLEKVLLDNYDMFARTNKELGHTEWTTCKVETTTEHPVYTPPYRMSKIERDKVDEEIRKMLDDDVIEPSTSAWSSPVVVVGKKGTTDLRVCVDLRKTNALLRPMRYPQGHYQDMLEWVAPPLGQTRYYTSLDGKGAYWQVPMYDEASRDKVSFHTANSCWRFKVMPFGLASAPAIFCELMRRVLSPVLFGSAPVATSGPLAEGGSKAEACAMNYMDDTLLASYDICAHARHLSYVLDLMRLAGLRFSAKKCVFGQRKVHVLGHVLDGVKGTIDPSPRHLQAIANFPRPTDVSSVRSFLGLATYYKDRIKCFSLLAAPLTDLTKKGREWRWGDKEEQAFKTIKEHLLGNPILRAPDFEREFIVQTDFCRLAVAAILSQKDDKDQEYVVQYASKKLNPAQQLWSSADGEAYAAAWAIKHWRPYLFGRHFTLVTDSMSVRYLKTALAEDLHGKLGRVALRLQQYDFDIVFKAGRQHSNVDGLSRIAHLIEDPEEAIPDSVKVGPTLIKEPPETNEEAEEEWNQKYDAYVDHLTQLLICEELLDSFFLCPSDPPSEVEIFMSDGMTDANREEPHERAAWIRRQAETARAAAAAAQRRNAPEPPPVPEPAQEGRAGERTGTEHQPTMVPQHPGAVEPSGGGLTAGGAQTCLLGPAMTRAEVDAAHRKTAQANQKQPARMVKAKQPGSRGAIGASSLAAPDLAAAGPSRLPPQTHPTWRGIFASSDSPSLGAWEERQGGDHPPAGVGDGEEEAGQQEETSSDPDPDTICQVCKKARPSGTMLLCDFPGCDTGWHMTCLRPPVKSVPTGEWICPRHSAAWNPAEDEKPAAEEDQTETPSPEAGPIQPGDQDEEEHCDDGVVPVWESDWVSETSLDTEDQVTTGGDESEDEEYLVSSEPSEDEAQELEEEHVRPHPETMLGNEELDVWNDEGLLHYLRTGQIRGRTKASLEENLREAARIKKRATRYEIRDETLFKITVDKANRKARVRVPRAAERFAIIMEAHNLGHYGINKTYEFIAARYWWPGMKNDVAAYVRTCSVCVGNRQKLLRSAKLHSLPIVPINVRVHLDLMGPFKTTTRYARYAIVAVDSFSKYPEVGTLPNKQSSLIRQWFWENWICRYGTPEAVLTDQGTEFEKDFDRLLREQHIKHLRTAGYHPQTNGQVERINGVFLDTLRKIVADNEGDWDLKLHQAAYAYRATPQNSTGVSPALALFGRELVVAGERPIPPQNLPLVEEDEEWLTWEQGHHEALQQRRVDFETVTDKMMQKMGKVKAVNERQYQERQLKSRPRSKAGKRTAPSSDSESDPEAMPVNKKARTGRREPQQRSVVPTRRVSCASMPKAVSGAKQTPLTGGPEGGQEGPSKTPVSKGPNTGSPASSVRMMPVDNLAELPDLPEKAHVYITVKKSSKLKSGFEGPYYFDAWHTSGKHAMLKDGQGREFSVAIHRLRVETTYLRPKKTTPQHQATPQRQATEQRAVGRGLPTTVAPRSDAGQKAQKAQD